MSIWASITGDDPVIYDGGYGDEIEPRGWLDVATSALDGRVRIIIQDRDGEARISLDAAGLAELHRRIVIARGSIQPDRSTR